MEKKIERLCARCGSSFMARVRSIGVRRQGQYCSKRCSALDRPKELNWHTHGLSKTPTYQVWVAMKQRCSNPTHPSYPEWGGRGITVCERWVKSFENFLLDMGEKPEGLSIERRDNNKGYSPENCYWATDAQQLRNTRRTRLLTHDGRTMCLRDWSNEFGIAYMTLRHRLLKLNWSMEKALLTPARRGGAHV